jgi:hypothetical protein
MLTLASGSDGSASCDRFTYLQNRPQFLSGGIDNVDDRRKKKYFSEQKYEQEAVLCLFKIVILDDLRPSPSSSSSSSLSPTTTTTTITTTTTTTAVTTALSAFVPVAPHPPSDHNIIAKRNVKFELIQHREISRKFIQFLLP